jgi:glycosyltransferase involved in cell wall biosynthesis
VSALLARNPRDKRVLPERLPTASRRGRQQARSGVCKDSQAYPLVSIIMPVYNHCNYVIDAIESVYSQCYRPIELIIIDDGSSDGSAAVVRDFLEKQESPPELTVRFKSRENRGAHATINEGIDYAGGEYISILNSDDLYVEERLARCVEAARLSNANLVFTYVEPIGEDGTAIHLDHPWRRWYNGLVMDELDRVPSLSFLFLSNNIAVSSGNLFFHRRLVGQIGNFSSYKYAHDVDFVLRACRLQEPVLVREKFYKYRLHATNTISPSSSETDTEYGKITKDYLISTMFGVPNPLAPSFGSWPNSIGKLTPIEETHIVKAFDACIEPARPAGVIPEPIVSDPIQRGGRITIATHEMSLTGAPVLALEMAKALKHAGTAVSLISMQDGPLVSHFGEARIPVVILRPLIRVGRVILRRVRTLLGRARHAIAVPIRRFFGRVRYFPRAGLAIAFLIRRFFGRGLLRRGYTILFRSFPLLGRWRTRLMLWRNVRIISRYASGTLLLNSFASYPLAFRILPLWKGPIFWYIHETYDPRLLLGGKAVCEHFDYVRTNRNISFLFGSEATRLFWAKEGYDGRVCHWSGLRASLADGHAIDSAAVRQPQQKRCILSVGTSGPRKGTRALIEAFAHGSKKGLIPIDTELVIVGVQLPSKDSQARDFVLRSLRPDIRGRVRLVGMADPAALHSYYAEADVYVQASNMECLPLALLTAMAYGLPIVTTDVDGCKEAIIDGVCGITVPPRQIELMAEAIGQIFQSPENARNLGQAARSTGWSSIAPL